MSRVLTLSDLGGTVNTNGQRKAGEDALWLSAAHVSDAGSRPLEFHTITVSTAPSTCAISA